MKLEKQITAILEHFEGSGKCDIINDKCASTVVIGDVLDKNYFDGVGDFEIELLNLWSKFNFKKT